MRPAKCDGQTAGHILLNLSRLTTNAQCSQVHATRRQSSALLRVPVLPRKSSWSTRMQGASHAVPMDSIASAATRVAIQLPLSGGYPQVPSPASAPLNTRAVTRAPTSSTGTRRKQHSRSQAPAAGALVSIEYTNAHQTGK